MAESDKDTNKKKAHPKALPSKRANDPDTSGMRGGTPGATDKGEIEGIAGTGGTSGTGGIRATPTEPGAVSGIDAPLPPAEAQGQNESGRPQRSERDRRGDGEQEPGK